MNHAHTAPDKGAFLFLEDVPVPPEVDAIMRAGGVLLISVSGGKDSDAMTHTLIALHRQRGWTGEIRLIHADMGRMEWRQTPEYVRVQAEKLGLPLAIVHHAKGDLLDGIERRRAKRPDAPPFPSSAARWCTSDYKRSPICCWIRQNFPRDRDVICTMGLRAGESMARSKRPTFTERTSASAPTKNRRVYDWLPIHTFDIEQVWRTLGYTLETLSDVQRECRDVAQQGGDVFAYLRQIHFNAHPAYALGNDRLSCGLCVLANRNDLLNGAQYNPDLYRRLVELEITSGFAFRHNDWLGDLRPDLLSDDQHARLTQAKATPRPTRPKASVPVQLSLFAQGECS